MINFKRDLLLVDLETTGLDADKHEIIQIAAVLLDQRTLKEKDFFNSFVRPQNWQARSRASMAVNGIKYAQLQTAPSLREVIKQFNQAFPHTIILSYYAGVLDMVFLQKAYQKAKIHWPFDYHFFNIWAAFYLFMAQKKQLRLSKQAYAGFKLVDLIKYFKLSLPKNLHDALTDCRTEAEILRKIIKQLSQ